MPAPIAAFTAQARRARIVIFYGTFSNAPVSGTVTLPAATVPNGAVTISGTVVLNHASKTFIAALSSVAYGDYDAATITLSNADGSVSVTAQPLTVYAPGTMQPGTAVLKFPAFAAPPFTAAAVEYGQPVTDFTVESTSTTSAQANVPFTLGYAFKQGDLAPTDFLAGHIAGETDIPLQFNIKATHPDGSVRHAVISGVLPSLAMGASKTVRMARATSGAATVPAASPTLTATGFSARVNITVGATAYHADATAALNGTLPLSKVWIGGAIATEYTVNLPFITDANVEHPDLTAQFNVRYYPGANAAKVDVSVEHTKAYTAIADIAYTGSVVVGGVTRYTISAADGPGALVHYPCTRWKKTFWWNHDAPAHIKHNTAYLIGTKQVPNYDQRVAIDASLLQKYATDLDPVKFAPMGQGRFTRNMGATGGRADIGLMPDSYAAYLLSQDKRAKAMMLASADVAGSWHAYRRDNSAGPGSGRSITLAHWPRSTLLGGSTDSANGDTGLREKFPTTTTTTQYFPDSSHQPAFALLPYLVTGDYYYLEDLHFWCHWNLYRLNPGYRDYQSGLYKDEQLRGQGWDTRTLAFTAALTPDAHPDKMAFRFWMDRNLAYYNTTYTDNPNANTLGIVVDGATVEYSTIGTDTGIGPWQDDFFTQAVGHAAELGFTEAARLLAWKAKFQIGRMIAPGVCWIDAAIFSLGVRDTETSPFFATLAEAFGKTVGIRAAMPCNSPERLAQYKLDTGNVNYVIGEMLGHSSSATGYPSNYQPALAMCVDANAVEDSDIAWEIFDTRVIQPKYGIDGPQFAVVPRGYAASVAVPYDEYTVGGGQAMYFGRASI